MSFSKNDFSTHRYSPSLRVSTVKLYKVGKTSNASFHVTKLKTPLVFQSKFKKLLCFFKWSAGRSSSGRIVVHTRGSKTTKLRLPLVNYTFRDSAIFFMGGISYLARAGKVTLLSFTSSGFISYLPFSPKYTLFNMYMLNSSLKRMPSRFKTTSSSGIYREIHIINYLLYQQKKNSPISFLELIPLEGIKYTRSLGSKAFIKKMDTRTGLALVVLSSGLKKVFSIYSLSSSGSAMLPVFKKIRKNTKFGNYAAFGKKPKVRGVAKNPVDHPHGGKTHAIRYPRTP